MRESGELSRGEKKESRGEKKESRGEKKEEPKREEAKGGELRGTGRGSGM